MNKLVCYFIIVAAFFRLAGVAHAQADRSAFVPNCDVGADYPRLVSRKEVLAILQGPQMQGLARKIANKLIRGPFTDVTDLERWLSGAFRVRLEEEVTEAGGDLFRALGWTASMTASELLSCFPDLAAAQHTIKARLEAEKDAAKFRVPPMELLGTGYTMYIALKGCTPLYISPQQIQEARHLIKRVEDKIAPRLGQDVNKEIKALWDRANQAVRLAPRPSQELCRGTFDDFMEVYEKYLAKG